MPYWQVPRMAALDTIVYEDGSLALVCSECKKSVAVFLETPTLEAVVKAAKKHRHK